MIERWFFIFICEICVPFFFFLQAARRTDTRTANEW